MRKTEHPAYQPVERKFRKYLGILVNAEECLKADGFDLAGAYSYATAEHARLAKLAAATAKDPKRRVNLRAAESKAESALFERLGSLLEFIKVHQPEHPLLGDWLAYQIRWQECLGEPIRSLEAEDLREQTPDELEKSIDFAPSTYGVAWARLMELRDRIAELGPSLEFAGPYTVFLCGLVHAHTYAEGQGELLAHEPNDGLPDMARQALEDAIDFAMLDETLETARNMQELVGDPAFSCLYMGVGYSQQYHSPDVYEWLAHVNYGDYQDNLIRLLFAMGVRTASDIYAREILSNLDDPNTLLGPPALANEIHEIVNSFFHST
jgi:hypothetical protein